LTAKTAFHGSLCLYCCSKGKGSQSFVFNNQSSILSMRNKHDKTGNHIVTLGDVMLSLAGEMMPLSGAPEDALAVRRDQS
jgi:hypothetical protein